ncbi:hypothetical protein BGX28_001182, partial [Mortierella sp. GBA30]
IAFKTCMVLDGLITEILKHLGQVLFLDYPCVLFPEHLAKSQSLSRTNSPCFFIPGDDDTDDADGKYSVSKTPGGGDELGMIAVGEGVALFDVGGIVEELEMIYLSKNFEL